MTAKWRIGATYGDSRRIDAVNDDGAVEPVGWVPQRYAAQIMAEHASCQQGGMAWAEMLAALVLENARLKANARATGAQLAMTSQSLARYELPSREPWWRNLTRHWRTPK